MAESSIRFFDEQFRAQIARGELALNPFEREVLPHLRGRVLDYGCGLGNLGVAAARRGCTVVALDGSAAAIAHLRQLAAAESLPIDAREADLRVHGIEGEFDCVVSIGLLMFFDCATAMRQLAALRHHVAPAGLLAVNVLVAGTTYMAMFDPSGHCLFAPGELSAQLRGWELLHQRRDDFPAPGGTLKCFETVVARRPAA